MGGNCTKPKTQHCAKCEIGRGAAHSTSCTPELRFRRSIAKRESGCWEWTGLLNSMGYAVIGLDHGKRMYAHRFSYMQTFGEIPAGYVVMHTCDNPRCVNPEHLRAGTQKENVHDMVAKGRGSNKPETPREFCRKGHRLAAENIGSRVMRGVRYRQCLTCVGIARQARRAECIDAGSRKEVA
jgi:hypothetical protein